jgi:hypothetical protein
MLRVSTASRFFCKLMASSGAPLAVAPVVLSALFVAL